MKQETALRVCREAGQDQRIAAQLDTLSVRGENGYRVKLTLRRGHRLVTVGTLHQWKGIKQVWREL